MKPALLACSLVLGVRAAPITKPSAALVTEDAVTKAEGDCEDPRFPYPTEIRAHLYLAWPICYSQQSYAEGAPNPGCSSWCCRDISCTASCR